MEDTLQETDSIEDAAAGAVEYAASADAICALLREHNGQDVSLLDLRKISGWTDFFIIATVTSNTHMDGLEKHIKDFCRRNNVDIFGSSRKNTDDQWRLIDLGSIIIHLMNKGAREFYELERLWTPIPASRSER